MMPDPRKFFSAGDLEAIRKATKEAESGTSGEIVPVVVGACDGWEELPWKVALFGSLAVSLAAALFHVFGSAWPGSVPFWILLPPSLGAAVGFALGRLWPAWWRCLIPGDELEHRVAARARVAFLEEEVFATRERTGILIFLALFERRVVVLGDAGINQAVRKEEWDDVVEILIRGIRSARPGPALVEAIGECGRILAEHGVEIRQDDSNELEDGLRMEDR